MNEGKASLFKKMAAVMGELTRLPKNGHNNFFNYDFVEDGDVFDAVRKQLAAHGLAFFASMPDFDQSETVNEKGKASVRTLATFEFTFGCADTGECMTFKWTGEAVGNDDKGLNKASTAALKYFLLKTFILSSGDDPDASGSTTTTVTKPTTTSPAKRTNPYQAAQQQPTTKSNTQDQPGWEMNNQTEGVLIMQVKNAVDAHPSEVANTVKKMRNESAFDNCPTFADAVALAIERVNSHKEAA